MLWVVPGVELGRARFLFSTSLFIRLDFPTLDRPAKTISDKPAGGKSRGENALATNSASITFTQNHRGRFEVWPNARGSRAGGCLLGQAFPRESEPGKR